MVEIGIGDRNITHLRFADDIDALTEKIQQLEALVESLKKPAQGVRWRPELRRPN